jgi:2Fe-2S ferredoxin
VRLYVTLPARDEAPYVTRRDAIVGWRPDHLCPRVQVAKLTIIGRDGRTRTVEGVVRRSVLDNVLDAGFDELLAICGGTASCGTCHVYVEAGPALSPASELEIDMLESSDHRTDRSRLACQLRFDETLDGLTVRIAPED